MGQHCRRQIPWLLLTVWIAQSQSAHRPVRPPAPPDPPRLERALLGWQSSLSLAQAQAAPPAAAACDHTLDLSLLQPRPPLSPAGRGSPVTTKTAIEAAQQRLFLRSGGVLFAIAAGCFALYSIVEQMRRRAQREQALQQALAERTAALRQSEAWNQAVLNAIPDVIIRMHRDGTYLDVKPANAFPTAAPETVGLNVQTLLPHDVAQQRLRAAERALQTGEIQVYEFPLLMQDQMRWQEVHVTPLGNDEVLILIRDLTRRKQAEAALRRSEARTRAILSTIPDIMTLISKDGIYLDSVRANAPADLIPAHINPVGRHISEFLPPDQAERKLQAIRQAIATGVPQSWEQQTWVHGKLQYEEVRVVACFENAALVIIRDISDRYQVDRIKNEFVSIVSHELRTPLTAIRGSLGILDSGVLDDDPQQVKEMLKIALNNSDRLVRLVNDILDLERLESGKVRLRLSACDAMALMRQAVEAVQPIANEANVHLSASASALSVYASADAVVQTLTNLLSNAIKFSPTGGTVWLRAERIEPGQAVFSVKDYGRGIPLDKLEAIFGRFQQVDVSDSRDKGGTGLGLAICKSIVQQHGGRIWAESSLGQGSTFFFTLPLVLNEHMDTG